MNHSAEPKLWSTESYEMTKVYELNPENPNHMSIDFIVIFNRIYELMDSYELSKLWSPNSWTKSKNLRLIFDRSYEVKETVNFVFMNDYCANDH